jgi:hypothetical protein
MAPPSGIRRRRNERGAAVFIVVLVITLLTAIGVYALRNASLVDRAAGYDRVSSQTAYLSEYAARSATAELGNGTARTYLDKIAVGTDVCFVNQNLDPNALGVTAPLPCYKLFISEIGQRVDANFAGHNVLDLQQPGAAGSLGPRIAYASIPTLQGVFVVEMTDPAESVPTAGSTQGGNNPANAFRDVQVTLTAFSQVRPNDPNVADPWCAANSRASTASVAQLRSHITLKNVPR